MGTYIRELRNRRVSRRAHIAKDTVVHFVVADDGREVVSYELMPSGGFRYE